jgi:hypothetical protein
MTTTSTLLLEDNLIPPVPGGTYTIKVSHTLSGEGPNRPGVLTEPVLQNFTIKAPRFALAEGDVHTEHPPADSSGEFGRVLAHVTLTRRALPWEVKADGDRKAPWVAVLVFAEHELDLDPGAAGLTQPMTVEQLLKDRGGKVLPPKIDPGKLTAEDLALTCRTIDVPPAVFSAVAPMAAELPLLAHVRRPDKTTAALSTDPAVREGAYGLVVTNRLPIRPGRYAAHLVSLEGHTERLPKPGTPGPELPLRLVCLHSWSFTSSTRGGPPFSTLVQGVAAPGVTKKENLLLRLPLPLPEGTDGDEDVEHGRRRIAEGFVPLSYRLDSGEQTYAWYRGPCTPIAAHPLPDRPAQRAMSAAPASATDLLTYHEKYGVFDAGYAAAWTLGRHLALADEKFATALARHLRAATVMVGRAAARYTGGGSTAYSGDDPAEELAVLLGDDQQLDDFHHMAGDGLADWIGAALAAPPPGSRHAGTDAGPAAPGTEAADALGPQIREYLSRPEHIAAVRRHLPASTGVHDVLTAWLDRLRLLGPVPFDHLVPDERMLPPESLRFFRIDADWTNALIDGAFSTGIGCTFDQGLIEVLRPTFDSPTVETLITRAMNLGAPLIDDAVTAVLRAQATGQPVADMVGVLADALAKANHRLPEEVKAQLLKDFDPGRHRHRSGLLLRSALVSGWPEMIIAPSAQGTPVATVRRQPLSDDILICLFEGVPTTLELAEPFQGLHLGVGDDGRLRLRSTGPKNPGKPLNKLLPEEGKKLLDAYGRPAVHPAPGQGVIDLAKLRTALAAALSDGGTTVEVGASGMATQMLRSPMKLSLTYL